MRHYLIDEVEEDFFTIRVYGSKMRNMEYIYVEFTGNEDSFSKWFKVVKKAFSISQKTFEKDVPIFVLTPAKTLKLATKTDEGKSITLTSFDENVYRGIFND